MAERRRPPPGYQRPPQYRDRYEQRGEPPEPPRRAQRRPPPSRGQPPQQRNAPPRRRPPSDGNGNGNRRNGEGGKQRLRISRRRAMTPSASMVVALFFGFVVVYMVLRAQGFFAENIDIVVLRLQNMEMPNSIPGMIIRYETVHYADMDGRLVFAVHDFERVREGAVVANILDVDAVERHEHERGQLQREVFNVHDMRHFTQSDPAVQRLNTNVRNRVERNMHLHMQSNLTDIYALLDTVTQTIENRNDLIFNESVAIRGDLNRQNELIDAQMDMSLSNIYAERGGIMSPFIDGFENLENFNPLDMPNLSREQIVMTLDRDVSMPGREVQEGDEIFKIVGNTWFVATWMPAEMTIGFATNTYRTIFLENIATGQFEPITMRIHRFDTYLPNYHFVIFRSTGNVIDFMEQRNVNIRLADSVQNGFIVPSTAIARRRLFRIPLTHVHDSEDDENYYLIRLRDDGGIQPIRVEIHERRGTHAYILEDMVSLFTNDMLLPFDQNVHTNHTVSDMDIVSKYGVYTTTLNYADFREVDLDGESLLNPQILLNPARNPNIRQFENIVADASMVRQGQVVR